MASLLKKLTCCPPATFAIRLLKPQNQMRRTSTFQEAITPDSIVGESAGRPTISCEGYENPRTARRTVDERALERASW